MTIAPTMAERKTETLGQTNDSRCLLYVTLRTEEP